MPRVDRLKLERGAGSPGQLAHGAELAKEQRHGGRRRLRARDAWPTDAKREEQPLRLGGVEARRSRSGRRRVDQRGEHEVVRETGEDSTGEQQRLPGCRHTSSTRHLLVDALTARRPAFVSRGLEVEFDAGHRVAQRVLTLSHSATGTAARTHAR